MAKPWTDDELDVLRRLFPTSGSRAVNAALPHRPVGSIKVIAHLRGVTCDVHYWGPGCGPKPRFARADILRAYRECDGNPERAAKLMGCSINTVRAAVERDRHERRMDTIAQFHLHLEAA